MTRQPIAFVSTVVAAQEEAYLDALGRALKGETICSFRHLTEQQRDQTEIAIVANPRPADVARLPRLAWIHSLWAGVERLVLELGSGSPPIVRLIDPEMARTMAESVLAWTYYLQRDMPAYRQQQNDKLWRQHTYRQPSKTTVGLLGYGAMGAAAAVQLRQAGFDVRAWSRSPKQGADLQTYSGMDGLPQLLSLSDIVVCLLPLTEQTRGLIDAQRIATMKAGAAFINFARGPIVVADDLVASLDSGHLSHAVLDVFDQEPLPSSSPFWQHPRITVLPHISGPTNLESAASVVAKNILAYRETGRVPKSVDVGLGY